MKNYVGNPLQIRGAEKYVLEDGRGDGMHFVFVRNGLGLEAWISVDRCADISRICVNGKNMAFFSPCGYVAPNYYDPQGAGFLKSFTAGFFTTCGLTAVGSPCIDNGEELPLHGTVSHIPAELKSITEADDSITIRFTVRDGAIFDRCLVMERSYCFYYASNTFTLEDRVINEGNEKTPFMLMYHCNMGYPLLSENSILKIPHSSFSCRNARAESQKEKALVAEPPQSGYEECCYYYDVKETDGVVKVGIYNPDISLGLVMSYGKENLPCFTQWKMMGKRDYVMGLEPANCYPDGRDVMREKGLLKFLKPDESSVSKLSFKFTDDYSDLENLTL